jgi:23S rRNA (uracil1939-C5)-methyltransferase
MGLALRVEKRETTRVSNTTGWSLENTVELTISDLARGGAGVAREASGRVVFVKFTAPGDRVRVRIIEESKNYAQGELIEILEASPERVQPRCPAFTRCGGCEWQHLPYALQWQTKVGGAKHALSRVGLKDLPEWEEMPAEQIWEYRTRVQARGERGTLGFYETRSKRLVSVERCEIARPEINAVWSSVRKRGVDLGREFKVELAVDPEGRVHESWNARHASALGFTQIHTAQNEKLQSWVASRLTPGRGLLDLYGGSGNLSLGLATRFSEIDCVDIGAPSAPRPGTPQNMRYHRSAVAPWFARTNLSRGVRSAILDPPREGLGEDHAVIEQGLRSLGVDELIAVGCDVDAWARDLHRFVKKEWRITAIGSLDFFPQTHHLENVALLKLGTF